MMQLFQFVNNRIFLMRNNLGASPRDQYDITSVHIGGVKNKKITSQYIGGMLGVKRVFFNYINMQYVWGYFISQSCPCLHHNHACTLCDAAQGIPVVFLHHFFLGFLHPIFWITRAFFQIVAMLVLLDFYHSRQHYDLRIFN